MDSRVHSEEGTTMGRASTLHVQLEKNNAARVNKLPNELLAEVFRMAHQPLPFGQESQKTLLSITSACSLWRQVALSTPGLWSHVGWSFSDHCRYDLSTSLRIGRRCGRVSEYLTRSRSSPISLYLHFGSNPWGTIKRVWEIVSAHLSRCRSLRVIVHNSGELSNILPIPGQLPRLESLDIKMLHRGLLSTTLFEQETPSPLRRLALRQITITDDGQSAWSDYLPIHALRSVLLRTSGRALHTTLDLLAQCPNLTDLGLTLDAETPPTYFHAVTFPQLEELSIPDSHTLEFARYIHAPKIQKITVSHGFWEPLPLGTFPTTSANTYPSLRAFRVLRFSRSPQDFVLDFCRRNSTIKTLSIDSWWTTGEFVANHLLTVEDDGGRDSFPAITSNPTHIDQDMPSLTGTSLLPALQSLQIAGKDSPGYDRTLAPEHIALYPRLLAQRHSLNLTVSKTYGSRYAQQLEHEFPARFRIVPLGVSLSGW